MTTNESLLKISESERDGVCVISIDGRLDSQTIEGAQSILSDAAKTHLRILLDCANTTFLSSAGLRAIVMTHRSAVENGGRVAVYVPRPEILATIHISGIQKLIPIHPKIEDAIAALMA